MALGVDYLSASQSCSELAVETDKQIEAARAPLSPQPGLSPKAEQALQQAPDELLQITEITSNFIARLRADVTAQVQRTDRVQRYQTCRHKSSRKANGNRSFA